MNNVEKTKHGWTLANEFWTELLKAFGDDVHRINMVIGDLQDRSIKLHLRTTKEADQVTADLMKERDDDTETALERALRRPEK